MNKDTLINIRISQDVKDEFQKIVQREGFTMSEVVQATMMDIIKRDAITLNVRSKIKKKANRVLTIPYIKKCLENAVLNLNNYGIKRISLFGSYANGTATAKSDVDLFIETDKSLSLFDLSGLKIVFETALNKTVDLITHNNNEYFMNQIEREKIPLYERRS